MPPHLKRRDIFRLAGAAASVGILRPLAAHGQSRSSVPRVGYLFSLTQSEGKHLWEAARQGLRELGYVEGRTIEVETRWAEGQYSRLAGLVQELEGLKPDVLVAAATPTNIAVKGGSSAIPVVFVAVADPVRAGLISGFARPGGRFTGLSLLTPETSGKRLELLKEMVPNLKDVAVLLNPGNLANHVFVEETRAAAGLLGIGLQLFEARNAADVEKGFAAAAAQRVSAMVVFDDPFIHSHRARIAALAAAHRIPAVYGTREMAEEGGLIAYGPHRPDLYRRSAIYVDKILKGAKPADLPVEQPRRFELVINLKVAASLGLNVPTYMQQRADEVIE